jgi:hypothetical protein
MELQRNYATNHGKKPFVSRLKAQVVDNMKEVDEKYSGHNPGRNYLQEMPLGILYEAWNSTRFSYDSQTHTLPKKR